MANFIPAGDGTHTGWKSFVQKVGGNLAGMVIPNIGAFIAWGLLPASFIPTGWLPTEQLSSMVGPTIINLLPIHIGDTGGLALDDALVQHRDRGGLLQNQSLGLEDCCATGVAGLGCRCRRQSRVHLGVAELGDVERSLGMFRYP